VYELVQPHLMMILMIFDDVSGVCDNFLPNVTGMALVGPWIIIISIHVLEIVHCDLLHGCDASQHYDYDDVCSCRFELDLLSSLNALSFLDEFV